MKHHYYLLYWLLWGPYQLLRLLAGGEDEVWEEDVLVVRDFYGREFYLVPDSISGAKATLDPHIDWNEHKWRQIDEAMEKPYAWTPVAEGVQHALLFHRKLGEAISGMMPAPVIQDSS